MSASIESSEPFLPKSESRNRDADEYWNDGSSLHSPKRQWTIWIIFSTLMLLFTNATTYLLIKPNHKSFVSSCVALTSEWSPIMRDVEITYQTVLFNSTVWGGSDIIYRQKPSPEVDEAWNAIGSDLHPMILTADEALKSGISLDRVKVGEKDGGPGYPAAIAGFHDIHCLNLLRQSLYFNSDYYHELKEGAWGNSESILQLHIGHCLDMLRSVLMCNPDTSVHPFVWAKHSANSSYPAHVFSDFERTHTCKNFNTILDYAKSSKLLPTTSPNILPEKDSFILPDWP